MFRSIALFSVIVGLIAIEWSHADDQSPGKDTAENAVRVMSFNIRYGTASDGENDWMHRREFLLQTITGFHPDLLGTQETLAMQKTFLANALPEYESIGVGRVDGKDDGEMMAIYFRRDRFEKVSEGHFWLSDTPEKVGSVSWDSSLPRMVTWVVLKDRKQTDSPEIAFLNTHFDHRGANARLMSSKLIRRTIGTKFTGMSIVLTGDFNTEEDSAPYNALFAPQSEAIDQIPAGHSPVVDSFRAANPQRTENEGTFSGFNSAITAGPRIDWIGVSRDWTIMKAEINRTSKDGKTPSDHFPITAVIHR
ncbi:MAG: endonuclease/exonuclease/phosphatase family protein [Planctomyces sp.]|nr:endonuclease/exonuclease/phosphatase family protein [Planctomyces sp.]